MFNLHQINYLNCTPLKSFLLQSTLNIWLIFGPTNGNFFDTLINEPYNDFYNVMK